MMSLFRVLMIGLVLLVPTLAHGQVGVISGTATAGVGGNTTICVNADANVKGMAGLYLDFQLPVGVTVVGTGKAAFKGGDFATGALTEANTNDPALVKVAIVGSEGKNGPISIGCIEVKIGVFFSGTINIVVEPNDVNNDPISVTVQPIYIAHGDCFPPMYVDENGMCKLVIKGDVNGDERLTVQDATLSLRFSLGVLLPSPEQRISGDVNGDGKWTVQDTTLILRRAIGAITKFPLE